MKEDLKATEDEKVEKKMQRKQKIRLSKMQRQVSKRKANRGKDNLE